MEQIVDKAVSLAIIAQLLILLLNEIKQIKSDVTAIRNTIANRNRKEVK
jgi:1,4-dihydroxy-2-naphthoate octaprenyltransferase